MILLSQICTTKTPRFLIPRHVIMKLLENGAYFSPKDEGYSKQSTSQKAKKERIRKFHSLLAATKLNFIHCWLQLLYYIALYLVFLFKRSNSSDIEIIQMRDLNFLIPSTAFYLKYTERLGIDNLFGTQCRG